MLAPPLGEPGERARVVGRFLARMTLRVAGRLLRFCFCVPLAAVALHLMRPQIPWWSWCGVCGASLTTMWSIDASVAALRRARSGGAASSA